MYKMKPKVSAGPSKKDEDEQEDSDSAPEDIPLAVAKELMQKKAEL